MKVLTVTIDHVGRRRHYQCHCRGRRRRDGRPRLLRGCRTKPDRARHRGSFGILAGSGITNTGPSTVTGDIGTFPTASITGLTSLTVSRTDRAGDSVTQGAKSDLSTAYTTAAGEARRRSRRIWSARPSSPASTTPPPQSACPAC